MLMFDIKTWGLFSSQNAVIVLLDMGISVGLSLKTTDKIQQLFSLFLFLVCLLLNFASFQDFDLKKKISLREISMLFFSKAQ